MHVNGILNKLAIHYCVLSLSGVFAVTCKHPLSTHCLNWLLLSTIHCSGVRYDMDLAQIQYSKYLLTPIFVLPFSAYFCTPTDNADSYDIFG